MVGAIHCHPLNFQSERGHKKGVGKKTNEWVGMSTSTWSPQAESSQSGRLSTNHVKRNARKNTMKLWVTL